MEPANRQFGERDGRALGDRDDDAVRPDALDQAVSYPVDSQQMTAALGERDLENALIASGTKTASECARGWCRPRRGFPGLRNSNRGSLSRKERTSVRRKPRRRRAGPQRDAQRAADVESSVWAALRFRHGAELLQNLLAQLRDAARAERQDHVAGFRATRDGVDARAGRRRVLHAAMSELPHAIHQRLRGHTLDGLLGSGVNIQHHHLIGRVKSPREIVHQVLGPRVAMRLKQHVNPLRQTRFRGRQSRQDLGGMVPVIVDDRNASLVSSDLEPPAHAGELRSDLRELHRVHAQFDAAAMAAVALRTL